MSETINLSDIDYLTIPDWIRGGKDLDSDDIDAICQGGCASGAFMPAVTYWQALETMSEHGDDVLQFIQDSYGELPKPRDDESWAGMAVHYLSVAVEIWASGAESEVEAFRTNLDEDHRDMLASVGHDDVHLSDASPLGLPFWVLKNSASTEEQHRLIDIGKPGSECPKGYLISNTEFTEHQICRASRNFMKRKLTSLETMDLPKDVLSRQRENVLAKACLCRDLAAAVSYNINIERNGRILICCGPGITSFSKKTTLEEMVDHIYGRISLLTDPERPHMFIKELKLYVEYVRKEVEEYRLELSNRTPKYFLEFKENIKDGIEYYRTMVEEFIGDQREQFSTELEALSKELNTILTDQLLELQPVEVS